MQPAALTVAAGLEDRCDMLLVVRHADAGDKGSWDGPDVGRPLSPAGCRQAEGLVVRLEDYPGRADPVQPDGALPPDRPAVGR